MPATAAPHVPNAVVIFTRPPETDARGKRLEHLGSFFRGLVERALAAARGCDEADLIVVGDLGEVPLPEGARQIRQRGAEASERFLRALDDVAGLGYRRIVAIGTDVPGLRSSMLEAAFQDLDGSAELVLGPAADGGAYLIGVRAEVVSVLAGMPWGTPDVLEALCAVSPRVALLDERLADIDDARSLRRLAACHALPRRLAALLRTLESSLVPPARPHAGPQRISSWGCLRDVSRRGPPRVSPAVFGRLVVVNPIGA